MQASVVNDEVIRAFDLQERGMTDMVVEGIVCYVGVNGANNRYRLKGICSRTGNVLSKFCVPDYALEAARQLGINIVYNNPVQNN